MRCLEISLASIAIHGLSQLAEQSIDASPVFRFVHVQFVQFLGFIPVPHCSMHDGALQGSASLVVAVSRDFCDYAVQAGRDLRTNQLTVNVEQRQRCL